MAKDPRITFEGEGEAEVMVQNFPAINKVLKHPIGAWYETFGVQGYRHGMKQRFGDLGALPKEMSDKERDTEHYERAQRLSEHLSAGGDWKLSPERDTTAEVVDAMVSLGHKREMLEKAVAFNPDQVKSWRANAKVKARIAKIRADKAAKAAREAEDSELSIEVGES